MRHSRVTGVVLTALAACAFAAPAHAKRTVFVDEHGRPIHGQLAKWARAAKVPLPGGRVQIRRAPCPSGLPVEGCVYTGRPRMVFLSPGLRQTRYVLLHELGHVFDLVVLNARERRHFKRILGIRRSGWFRGGLPPAEWFAEGYAACATRLRLQRASKPTVYGYAPTRRQHARVCRLIVAAAKPGGHRPKPPKNPPPVIEVQPPPPQETQPSEGCTLFDQLLSGCTPPPAPSSPLPV
ncbi:MAG: hypothetical protein QOE69_1051 [Thermoleophilaceae bacterium]|nr:hypothetical protein [Thermoleophilaceae bacterium]